MPTFVLLEAGDPYRDEAEAFIADRFHAVFGARATSAFPRLAALLDEHRVVAAAGVRLAEDEPLFLERYLDWPVEHAVAAAFGRPVARSSIAELGSLAASDRTSANGLFTQLSAWLGGPGRRRYAVATMRPELERLLRRTGVDPRCLAEARPERLGAAAAGWGAYYDARPRVFAGEITPAVSPSPPRQGAARTIGCGGRGA